MDLATSCSHMQQVGEYDSSVERLLGATVKAMRADDAVVGVDPLKSDHVSAGGRMALAMN